MLQSPFARKMSSFVALSDDDISAFEEFCRPSKLVPADRDMVHEGQSAPSVFILIEGWACSYKMLADGGRQILNFHIPGDFLGLRNLLFHSADQGVKSVTRIEVAEVLIGDIMTALRKHPGLAAAVLSAASRSEAMVAEHLVSLGRRSAEQRMAHIFLELGERLKLINEGSRSSYYCPLTQYHLADALGLSAVHVNRVLRHLREAGLVTFQRGRVTFQNIDALKRLANFDTKYLVQNAQAIGPDGDSLRPRPVRDTAHLTHGPINRSE